MSDRDIHLVTARARSVLARMTSGHAHWPASAHADGQDSLVTSVHLDQPERPRCAHRSPVVLEIPDPAPVAVRDRIRARVRLRGAAVRMRGEAHGINIQPTAVHFETDGATIELDPVDLWRAEPDPLALAEATLLGHLDGCHPETMTRLARLVPDEIRAHARRIAPLALDRGGIVVRVEHLVGHVDVRLPFDRDVTRAEQAPLAMAALLDLADPPGPEVTETRRHGLWTAIMQAGPAAARICAPRGATPPSPPGSPH